jgi:hypothetical protein
MIRALFFLWLTLCAFAVYLTMSLLAELAQAQLNGVPL